jgi:hypothetical protein
MAGLGPTIQAGEVERDRERHAPKTRQHFIVSEPRNRMARACGRWFVRLFTATYRVVCWQATTAFDRLVEMMVRADFDRLMRS